MLAIETRALHKTFAIRKKPEGLLKRMASVFGGDVYTHEAVQSLDLRVEKGESVAFIGPNGAGKSTTIKMLTGILHPTSGHAEVLGMVPWKERKQLAFQIGTVFGQKSQLWLHLPPLDTFNLLSRIYELDQKVYIQRREELIELFEIRDFIDVPVRKLSLGQRMRCEIAASLLHRPKAIFLDEPTIGLDPVAKASIRELIRRANREDGVTVFLTSHDAGDIERLCRRVIIINHGRMIFDDATNVLRRQFLTRKEIDLKLTTPWEGDDFGEGVTLVKAKGFGAKIAVETTRAPIDQVISRILRRYSVEDITIQSAPLEEIIADIYRQKPPAVGGGAG